MGVVACRLSGQRTVAALAIGALLITAFIANQARAGQPIMPLRLFADRERAGAYAARFLFNGALISFAFFMTQYLHGVTGDSPLQAGVSILPQMVSAFAAAAIIPRLMRRTSNATLAVLRCAVMLAGVAWMSRISVDTAYLTGIVLPMVLFGIGQGLGLSTLTTAGMARVSSRDAGAVGGVVNVCHHIGGAVGLGILVTIFNAARPMPMAPGCCWPTGSPPR